MKSLLTAIAFFAFFGWNYAQTNLQKADQHFENLGYRAAIQQYEQGSLTEQSMERLAHSYRLNHDTQNAEKWYAQIIESTQNPLNYLFYAQACQSNGNLTTAAAYFQKYDEYMGWQHDERGKEKNAALKELNTSHSARFSVKNATPFNSESLDFCPVLHKNGIAFLSTRKPPRNSISAENSLDNWTGEQYSEIYFTEKNGSGEWETPTIMLEDLNTKFHKGPMAFTNDGRSLFFTGNGAKTEHTSTGKKESLLRIFMAQQVESAWTKPEAINLGVPGCNDAHPAISKNGMTLFFASDRPGGYGGMDIYAARFSGGKWSIPINLGSEVNTPGNEVFPFVFDDGTLYFASDGRIGLGGLDLFFCDAVADFSWKEAVNLGLPFNSPKDDFGYVLNRFGTGGYFTSAREGGLGQDDIYEFHLENPQNNKVQNTVETTSICVFDDESQLKLNAADVTVLIPDEEGVFVGLETDFLMKVNSTGAADYRIDREKYDPSFHSISTNQTYLTDVHGQFPLSLSSRSAYLFFVKREGYADRFYEVNVNIPPNEICIPLNKVDAMRRPVEIPEDASRLELALLEKVKKTDALAEGITLKLENIYYGFGAWQVNEEAAAELDHVVEILNRYPDFSIELGSHTDSRGDDNFNRGLSARRAEAARNYILDRGVEPQRIHAVGYGEDRLLNQCDDGTICDDNAHRINRRTEIKVFKISE